MDPIKVIRTEADYEEALVKIEELIDKDPVEGSNEADQLEVLAMLAEKYEEEHFPADLPDPVSAIEFRMEQLDMKPVDLEPYIGPLSRVSEVLADKRPLTKKMIQALNEGLGIPTESLMDRGPRDLEGLLRSWPDKLTRVMDSRGYFDGLTAKKTADKLQAFFEIENFESIGLAMLRQSGHRLSPITDKHAQAAWSARVMRLASQADPATYKPGSITPQLMAEISKLSSDQRGVLKAKERLEATGILLIVEPHLPKTRLDGAVLRGAGNRPVIGMTLRYDRLDNFWFTLMHELAHICLHYDQSEGHFWDEVDIKGLEVNDKEKEADQLASESLVPRKEWQESTVSYRPTTNSAQRLANALGVDISIVVGKVRYESKDWGRLRRGAKDKTVRQFFPDKKWGAK